jgi:hypothetical protein
MFTFARYRLVLQPLDTFTLPAYPGNTFRGGFGTLFRRIACACGSDATSHHSRCLYAQVFETPRSSTLPALPATVQIPHPFVLEPPYDGQRVYTPDDLLLLHLVLIGQALDWLPYFIFTFEELGRAGLGRDRGRYRLAEVHSLQEGQATVIFTGALRQFNDAGQPLSLDALWQEYPVAESMDVDFLTYTRIVGQGQLQEVVEFPRFFSALLRRLASLMYAHGDGGTVLLPTGPALDVVDILRYFYDRHGQDPAARAAMREAMGLAAQVNVTAHSLQWEEWERYSGRQARPMPLGGVRGTVRYGGPLTAFVPYARVGEYLHVGKNTTFGLGQVAFHLVEASTVPAAVRG